MAVSKFTCPHCQYEASLIMFENVDNGILKCKRCRSKFEDPNAFGLETTYADCDSRRAVTRFPFALNGCNALIHVREGYMAFVAGNDGQRFWLEVGETRITNMPGGFQLYFVCKKPQIIWGTRDLQEFGAYGVAQLTITKSYAEAYCGIDGRVQSLEEHLREMVVDHMTDYVQDALDLNKAALLQHSDGYMNALGMLQEGVSLTKIEPRGYRNADGMTGTFPARLTSDETFVPDEPVVRTRRPVELAKAQKKTYTIREGVEEVFLRNASKLERHKAGEVIEANDQQDVGTVLRFLSKEFEFANGWGLYNQNCSAPGYYSAHGTISFYIDSTERISPLLYKAGSWDTFTEEFFSNVLKKELSIALRELMNAYVAQRGLNAERLNEGLSAMSVDLTNFLNGEGNYGKQPAFRQNGLRVNRADILHVSIYANRR